MKTQDDFTKKIFYAARKGDATALLSLLGNGANPDVYDEEEDYLGRLPLSIAAKHGHLECIKILLQHGADVNDTDAEMDAAITLAAAGGHTECVRFLLQNGADVNHHSVNGTPLIRAVFSGNIECVKMLLDAGAEANHAVSYGLTALKAAVSEGDIPCTELLIKHGAIVTEIDGLGFDEMMCAVLHGHEECAVLLTAVGGNPKYLGQREKLLQYEQAWLSCEYDDLPDFE